MASGAWRGHLEHVGPHFLLVDGHAAEGAELGRLRVAQLQQPEPARTSVNRRLLLLVVVVVQVECNRLHSPT